MGLARIYPSRKMHRSRAPSIAPGTFFVAQPWADCITNMPGFNLRQAQLSRSRFAGWTAGLVYPTQGATSQLPHHGSPISLPRRRQLARPVDQNAYLISTDFLETSAPEERTLFPISFSCSVAASYCVFRNSV